MIGWDKHFWRSGWGVEGYSILLLSFLLDLSDRQIALLLNSSKSSIQRRRTAFFETLKSKMKE